MKKLTLGIEGMHCGGCVEIVQHVIEQQDGIKGCTVSLEDRQARIAYDPERISADQIAQSVQGAGYTATPMNA